MAKKEGLSAIESAAKERAKDTVDLRKIEKEQRLVQKAIDDYHSYVDQFEQAPIDDGADETFDKPVISIAPATQQTQPQPFEPVTPPPPPVYPEATSEPGA